MKEVLIVDDERPFRRAVVGQFTGEQYSIIEASSPAEGIELLQRHPGLRVILLDLKFRTGHAEDVLNHIKGNAESFRVIVLTGKGQLLNATRAEEYHVFRYLEKAQGNMVESIRFSIDQAFKDLDRVEMLEKGNALVEIHRRIRGNQPVAQTLSLICSTVKLLLKSYTCHIRVYDFASGDFRLAAFAGAKGLRREFDIARSTFDLFSGEVASTGQSRTYDDLRENPEFRRRKGEAARRESIPNEVSKYYEEARSAHIAPISTTLFDVGINGTLNVSATDVAFFDARKQAVIGEFADVAALAIDRDWLEHKHEELHRDYGKISKLLSEMRTRLVRSTELSEVYRLVTGGIVDLIGAEVVSIFLVENAETRPRCVAEHRGLQFMENANEELSSQKSLTRYVFESGTTLLLPDDGGIAPIDDQRFERGVAEGNLDAVPSKRFEHFLAVPIWIDGEVRGVLRAINKKSSHYDPKAIADSGGPASLRCLLKRGFSGDCRTVLEIAANHLGIAIHNARVLAEKEHEVEQKQSLSTAVQTLGSSLKRDDFIELVISAVTHAVQADTCLMFLREEDSSRLGLVESNLTPKIADAFHSLGIGIVGAVADGGEAVLWQGTNPNHEDKYAKEIEDFVLARSHGARAIESMAYAPILADGQIIGVLQVVNKRHHLGRFSIGDLENLSAVGVSVGNTLSNAKAYLARERDLEIARRNETLGQLVSAVAHEINNTAGCIPANVDSIRASLGHVDERVEKMLDIIVDVSTQATEFASEIAGFSASNVGLKRIADVNAILQRAIDSLSSEHLADQDLRIVVPTTAAYCAVFETPLVQVFRNIVMNARQALEKTKNGLLTVSSITVRENAEQVLVLRFRDNGPGVDLRHRSKIFEADFTTKPKGNGIGLWLARKHLEEIGGTLTLEESAEPGACFVIRIPMAEPPSVGVAE